MYWQKLFLDWHKIPSPLGPGIDDTEHLSPPRFGEQFPCQLRADCRDRYRTSCRRSSGEREKKRKESAAPDRSRKLKPALPGGIFTKTSRCTTYRPSSPAGSGRSSCPSCGHAGPSTGRPAPGEAFPPSAFRCWTGSGWRAPGSTWPGTQPVGWSASRHCLVEP